MKPLTPKMQHVVDRMRQGWSLTISSGIESRCYLQHGKPGHGGEMEVIPSHTVAGLINRNLLEHVGPGPGLSREYRLKGWDRV